ncbi:glycoside hydrolase family 5 protein [Pseudomonas sp. RIT-PI-AD]|uniref:glycoside hydrolase family 5 protein n=1 Tax=Pseudomonas sp. RIT-PI-AD TaxID=3035294 RepID=UPI0021D93160|nr:glycoside hydrolase family 5 protein [Pseudomonas sp. RIT-PI-AD]
MSHFDHPSLPPETTQAERETARPLGLDLSRRTLMKGLGLTFGGLLLGRAGAGMAATPAAAANTQVFAGLNLSGLSLNSYVENAELGTHYRTPEDKHIVAAGDCPFFRLPVTAARLTQSQGFPLIERYCKEIEQVLNLLQARGKKAILELHDFMRLPTKVAELRGYTRNASYQVLDPQGKVVGDLTAQATWGNAYRLNAHLDYIGHFDSRDGALRLYENRIIGTAGCQLYTLDGLPDLWMRIVKRFRDHPAILGWGIMNEPYTGKELNADGSPFDMRAHWLETANRCAAAIIYQDKQHNLFICGNEFASALMWKQYSMPLFDIPDPYNQIVYEAHNYLDNKGSGGGQWRNRNEVVDPNQGVLMVQPFIEALQQYGKRGFLGEHGYPEGNQSAYVATVNLLKHLQAKHVMNAQWCFGPGFPDDDELGLSKDSNTSTVPVKANINAVKPFFTVRLPNLQIPA